MEHFEVLHAEVGKVTNNDEAETVREIFEQYVRIGSVSGLQKHLEKRNIRSKFWTTQKGVETGGMPFSRGALYTLLQNPIYIGRIRHKEQTFVGQHIGIICPALWEKVQCQLAKNRVTRKHRTNARSPSLLKGLLEEVNGNRFRPRHANKNGARYLPLLKNISGGVLQGSPQEKVHYALTGEKPHRDTKVLQMLGNFKVPELTTAQLRRWHNVVRVEAGHHTANRVMSMLKGILALAKEDFGVRVCSMPTNLARRKSKPKKEIMTPEEITKFIAHAKLNPDRSIYVIFPLMTGARISEILGLLWQDIDFERNLISIVRVQERDGTTTNTTKTEAGECEIPISPTLRTMLREWRLRCPRLEGKLYRVFPGPGVQRQWPLPRIGGGGPILYSNFLKRYWKPAFVDSGVRYVSLHACRHSFISILQSQGVDLAVVSEIVGHNNPAVTLGHYTQAVRGGAEALAMLDKAYQGE